MLSHSSHLQVHLSNLIKHFEIKLKTSRDFLTGGAMKTTAQKTFEIKLRIFVFTMFV